MSLLVTVNHESVCSEVFLPLLQTILRVSPQRLRFPSATSNVSPKFAVK